MLGNIKSAVSFFAHSDDEMLAAGTLHRLVRGGVSVHVVTFSPAAIESDRLGHEASRVVVLPEWHEALDTIGVAPACRHMLDFTPSYRLRTERQAVCQAVFDFCDRERPDVAFIPSQFDAHPEHIAVGADCEGVMRGLVPVIIRCQFPWDYGGFRPNLFVRLEEEDVAAKRAVIDAYRSQHFRYQYAEMLMSYVRGDGLSIKASAAEKFELIRGVL